MAMLISGLTDNVLTKVFNARVSMLMLSKPGHAKTAWSEQFATRKGLGLVPFVGTQIDAPDWRGYAIPTKNAAGIPVTKFTLPPAMEMMARTGKSQGILLLEEFLQSDHLVQKAQASAFSERMIGEHPIPEGWVVWALSNRVGDRAGTNKILGHVTNRVTIFEVYNGIVPWAKWAVENNIHHMYIGFAQYRPGLVFDSDTPANPEKPYITPRSYTNACRFHMQDLDPSAELPTDEVTQEFIRGFIGEGAAAEFFSYLKVDEELPTIEQIRDSPMTAKLPPKERLDAQYAAMQLVIHHATPETIDPLFKYVERLNKELQTSTVKQLIDKSGGALLNSKALTAWIAANRALVHATLNDEN